MSRATRFAAQQMALSTHLKGAGVGALAAPCLTGIYGYAIRTAMTMEDQNAQKARRDEVEALPRPEQLVGLDSRGIQQAARGIQEIANTVRVYSKQWLFEFRAPSQSAAEAYFKTKLSGRLEQGDWRFAHKDNGDVILEVRVWNVCSEWHDRSLAESYVARSDSLGEYEIVDRNSRREHELQQYGQLKLTVREARAALLEN